MVGRISYLKLLLLCLSMPARGFSAMMSNESEHYDLSFVCRLATFVIKRHQIESCITFVSNRASNVDAPALHNSLEPEFALANLTIPMIVCGPSSNITFWKIVTQKTLVIATIHHFSPQFVPMLDTLDKALTRRRNVFVLFIVRVLRHRPPTMRQLREFFLWCWQHNFVNVVITFQHFQYRNGTARVHKELFTYTPFPSVKPLNVTKFGANYPWPGFKVKNVHGYVFHTPVFQDPPASFLLPDGQLGGVTGSLVVSYIESINGRIRTEAMPGVNRGNYHMKALLGAARGEIDIGVHPFSAMNLNASRTAGVFSFSVTQTCLLVPWNQRSQLDDFIKQSYSNLWLFLLLITFVPLFWQLTARRCLHGVYLVFVLYYLQALDGGVFRRMPRAYKIVHLSLLMGVFLLRNMRGANLLASFSVKSLGPQVNTVEEFLRTSLRLMLTPEQVEMYFDRGLLPEVLRKRFLIVDTETMTEHISRLNTSYAYLSSTFYAQLVHLKQFHLYRPRLRLTQGPELCTSYYFLGLPVQWNSPFKKSLFHFYLKSLRSGLEKMWIQHSWSQIIKVIGKESPELPVNSINLQDFSYVLRHLCFLLGICILVLLGEILWNKLETW
ncbi:hypothetical protein KR222_006282, partial [Zaprionus bogoriensis]